MPIAPFAEPLDVDVIEELRLRRWARENYCDPQARQSGWHPVVHDEMRRRDADVLAQGHSVLIDDAPSESPDDSTILTDEPIEHTPEPIVADLAVAMGPIVPLAPEPAGLHGPHEITPPHTRIGAPVEKTEMHYT